MITGSCRTSSHWILRRRPSHASVPRQSCTKKTMDGRRISPIRGDIQQQCLPKFHHRLSPCVISQSTRRVASHRLKSNISNSSSRSKRSPDATANNSSSSSQTPDSWTTTLKEVVPLVGVFAWRLCLAYGMVYVFWEYGVEITICEGPSMIPTLKGDGDEIVLLDRWTPRLLGLQGGPSGSQRAIGNRQKQRDFVQQFLRQQQFSSSLYPNIWHDPKVPANTSPSRGMWERLRLQVTTPISVGDVVVLQHPHRAGTVCKRVLGLPGDTVISPRSQTGASRFFYLHGMEEYVEDGSQTLSRGGKNWESSSKGSIYSTMTPYQTNLPKLKRQQRTTTFVVPDGHLWVEGDNPCNSNDSRNYGPIPASLIVGRVVCRIWPITGAGARIERGDRPIHASSEPSWSFFGSICFPAGYRDEIIVRDYQQWQRILQRRQHQHQQLMQQAVKKGMTSTIPRTIRRDMKSVAAAEPKDPTEG